MLVEMIALIGLTGGVPGEEVSEEAAPRPIVVEVPSTLDGAIQPCRFVPSGKAAPQPLLVFLHPWSHGYDTYDCADWEKEAAARGWHALFPHFRGPNRNPQACASPEARQDVLDAVDWVRAHYEVDPSRIYLAGVSGGGHMAMVMAAHAPGLWAGVSAWVGISDLTAWYHETKAAGHRYWQDLEGVAGEAPGSSEAADQALRARSPIYYLVKARHVPLDLNTGIDDGHSGSVPIHHTLDAFNVIAESLNCPVLNQKTIDSLSRREVSPSGQEDPVYGRVIHLRRTAGPSRVTVFEGGHEGLPGAACAWLEHQRRAENSSGEVE